MVESLSSMSFQALAFALSLIAIFGFGLAPGGLAWALSKARTMAIPGPHGFPVSGSTPRGALAELAKRFKALPLMAFSVWFTCFIRAGKRYTAKNLNSSLFADRPVKKSAYGFLFHRAMGFARYGEYWRNLRKMVSEGYDFHGIFNWSDHSPLLGWLDLQGVRKRCGLLVPKINAFVGKIIEEHRLKRANGQERVARLFLRRMLVAEGTRMVMDLVRFYTFVSALLLRLFEYLCYLSM